MGVIIEFVGCSGAGKTTLERKVREEMCRLGIKVFSPLEFAAPKFLQGKVCHERSQNIVLEVGLLPYIREVRRHYKDFLFYTCRMLMKYADSPHYALRGFRGVWRRTASFVAARRKTPAGAVTLLDEGTIQIAHYLFGQVMKEPEHGDLELFWRLVPKPDLVIYLRTFRDVLALRVQERQDPPRRRLPKAHMLKFLQHAEESFEFLMKIAEDGNQWLTIDNNESGGSSSLPALMNMLETRLREGPKA